MLYSYRPVTERTCYRAALRLFAVPVALILVDGAVYVGAIRGLATEERAPAELLMAIPTALTLALPFISLALDRARARRFHAVHPDRTYRYTAIVESVDGDIDTHTAEYIGSDHVGFNAWMASITDDGHHHAYVDRRQVVAGGISGAVRLIPAK